MNKDLQLLNTLSSPTAVILAVFAAGGAAVGFLTLAAVLIFLAGAAWGRRQPNG